MLNLNLAKELLLQANLRGLFRKKNIYIYINIVTLKLERIKMQHYHTIKNLNYGKKLCIICSCSYHICGLL